MTIKSDVERYQANWRAEQDSNLAELYRRISETEQRH